MVNLTWYPIKEAYGSKIVGTAAFQGDDLIVVTSFYDDKDMNLDGEVSLLEKLNPFGMGGKGLAMSFTGLKSNPDLWMKDPNAINSGWGRAFVKLGSGLIADGIYLVYFNQAVGKLSGVAASGITSNPIKNFVIKKGMEKLVKKAYEATMP